LHESVQVSQFFLSIHKSAHIAPSLSINGCV
jgi:hypothetical protein